MDAVSYSLASKQAQRIEKFIENPDSMSGIVTVPKVIASGETITIPAGRVAILPNMQIDGILNIENGGEVFIPSGATLSTVVEKVTSTDNAIVRFDGATGAVQNSGVIIDDAGNVGIGVTPSAWSSSGNIEMMGSRVITSKGDYNISSNGYFNSGWKALNSDYVTNVYTNLGGWVWESAPFTTAGSTPTFLTKMALDANSNLAIGNNLNVGYNGFTTYGYGYLNCFNSSSSNFVALYPRTTSDTSTVFQANIAGEYKAGILANGTFQSANSAYGGTSDAKLKENVIDATPKLNKLMQVQVRNFNFIGQKDKQIGVIAQEIEQIFPGVVYETKDTKQVEVTKTKDVTDGDGNVTQEEYTETETQETSEVTKNVKYSIIYMMMLKGMQEQQEIINDLKSRIKILEGAK